MSQLRIAELDFDQIKSNLKTFLTAQTSFSDYDFEGSNLSSLLDVLAYNTHYNAYLANMVMNEMFLDSAIKRSSAVSIAKHLGYTPTSARGAVADIDVVVTSPTGLPTSLTMDRYTQFTTSIDGTTYTFATTEDMTSLRSGLTYTFNDVSVVEGTIQNFNYIVADNSTEIKYVLPSASIDTTTLQVSVQTSPSDLTTTVYTLATDITGLDGTSTIFFLEQNSRERYEINFGDGIIGKQLTKGNIVKLQFLVTSGAVANVSDTTSQTFSALSSIGGSTLVAVTVNSNSTGGADEETITSIKYNAPKVNATGNRLVTASDYEALLTSRYPNFESISVWGGEENDPPIYGKVIISLKPFNGSTVSDTTKNSIIADTLKSKKVLAIQPEFVDPTYYYVNLTVNASYNPSQTTLTSTAVKSLINSAVTAYFSTDLQKFNKSYNQTKLISSILLTSPSIFSINVVEKLQRRLPLVLNTTNIFTTDTSIKFRNSIQPGQLTSSYFYILNNTVSTLVKITDLPDSTPPDLNGSGVLRLVDTVSGLTVNSGVGTVNYATGAVSITGITPSGFPTGISELNLTCGIQNIGQNISLSRNEIFVIDDNTLNATGGTIAGVTINMTSFVQ